MTSFKKKLFWTSAQYSVLNDDDETKRRVLFTSPFGTGKTILLKAKARKLLIKGEKVVFVIFNDPNASNDSLLTFTYRLEFEKDIKEKIATVEVLKIKSGKMI